MGDNGSLVLLPDNQELELPGKTAADELKDIASLKHGTEDVGEAISGDKVKTSLLSQEHGINTPNYTLDLSKIDGEILDISLLALRSLMREEGPCSFYIVIRNGIARLGNCYGEDIVRILSPSLKYMFEGKGVIIKNFGSEKAVKIVGRDTSEFRLSL